MLTNGGKMNSRTPFVAGFKTREKDYIYDVNSNHILEVDPIISSIINDFSGDNIDELTAKYSDNFSNGSIKKAYNSIINMRAQGLFQSSGISKLQLPACRESVEKQISGQMQQLVLGITEICNLRCRYCTFSGEYKYHRTHTDKTMSADIAKKAIDYFMSGSVQSEHRSIGFYGGEPLAVFNQIKDLIYYVNTNYEETVSFNMTTNGTLLSDEISSFLIENNISIMVSIDGPENLHDKMRIFQDGRGSYKKIINNLNNLYNMSKEYYKNNVTFSVSLSNPDKLAEVYSYFISDNKLFNNQRYVVNNIDLFDNDLFKKGIIKEPSNVGYHKLMQLYQNKLLKNKKIDGFLKGLFELPLVKIHQRNHSKLGDSAPSNGICIPGIRRLYCTPSGEFTLCERVNPGLIIGNIVTGVDIDKVMSIMVEYSEKSLSDCKSCFAVRFCSACFTHIYSDEFDMEKKRMFCQAQREFFLKMLSFYCDTSEKNPDSFNYMDNVSIG